MDSYWIVIVDDDMESLKNAESLLNDQNLKVSALHSGRELLEFMEKNNPDLILLDVTMPQMDGFTTYQRLRQYEEQENRLNTPVVFLTGENDREAEYRGLEIGAADFIIKPFHKEILLQRIYKIIENSKIIFNLTEEATLDKLTGFLNKTSGNERLKKLCRTENGALMVIDLDSFKLVNDLYGHKMGDKVLVAFADVVRKNTRSEDILCRIGGDEFVAFYHNVISEDAVSALTARLNKELEEVVLKLLGEDHGVPIGASVGCAFIPEHGVDFEWLFQLADRALYYVKQNGKHGFAIHNPDKDEEEGNEDSLEKELARITQVIKERTKTAGAMWVGLDSATWIYRFLLRYLERTEETAIKLLFSLNLEPGGEETNLSEAVVLFGEVLQKTLRRSDIIFQSRKNQFFLLLPEMTEQYIQDVVDRIVRNWKSKGRSEGISVNYTAEVIGNGAENE